MKRRGVTVRMAVVGCIGAVFAGVVLAVALGVSSARPNPPGARVSALQADFASGERLGPLSPHAQLHLELTLANRDGGELARLIAAGRTVTPGTYARRFLPSASRVERAIQELRLHGLNATWSPGAVVVEATGSASETERALGVHLDRYRSGEGRIFYAPTSPPRLPPSLHGVISGVAGLDDVGRVQTVAAPAGSPSSSGCSQPLDQVGGYTPTQVMSAYHVSPLLQSGLTGAGETVVLLEIDTFVPGELQCFSSKFGQRPNTVSVAPERWGAPAAGEHFEADMDLELAHSIAPDAHLVVYYSNGSSSDIAAAAAAAVRAYPNAILSASIGGCEWQASGSHGNPVVSGPQTVWHDAMAQLAATGGSAFVASGDSGAYECGNHVTNSAGAEVPTVSFPADDPYSTAVGGTTLFVGGSGAYAGETAWGAPFEAAGSGGGLSLIWREPSWQSGPGVQNRYSDGYREVPDVSAVADDVTGWDIFADGSWTPAGGTSAAVPLWAALTALADQALRRRGLSPVGFASPLLYGFAQNPGRLPAPAFNDVTRGENLYYSATPGWDYATGLGSPNAAGMVDDLLRYRETHR